MGRIKSLITASSFDTAKRSHKCQGNASHTLIQGSPRLKVKNGLGSDYYCNECAKKILDSDINKLNELRKKFP
ncbi:MULTISPECIES: hypothetical protein [Citrobacter]|uniref:hypothetical protein n=1 Tax=Citrobacter sp. RHBSTW-00944 TaxID=2742671 RepID=UPI0015E4D9E2|nr:MULTISPECIES: hypothetical protein [Citrobacter]QLO02617.1 hypothetical protein HV141_03170 [Citrobacter freundii]QLO82881.1 hypothetical protein HV334_03050 [Citrobacter sp. RHBSTW-00944]QLU65243.1 hypothetical protein HV173_02980 [Citrobacter freundii]